MDKILILDFGSQYTQLIARRVRAEQVYCEVHPWHWPAENIRTFNPKGIILSGGPSSVVGEDDRASPYIQQIVLELGAPLLAICYGMQALAAQLGGRVRASSSREYGQSRLQVLKPWALLPPEASGSMDVWMSHGDTVDVLPQGFEAVMVAAHDQALAAMADDSRRWYGLQFHPEVSHTMLGQQMLGRFVHDVCAIARDWQMPHFIQSAIADIRRQVGTEQVVLGLSGGVDSSVAAALIHQAIGRQLTCIFVDNGLLRLDEGRQVMTTMKQHLGVQVQAVNASERFLAALSGTTDPEAKRKIIGREFIHVFQEQAAQIPGVKWLAQGTIYPDVIESAASGKQAQTIKSHHNVGGLPDTLHLQLLEPLRMLFKDEVREAGIALGLPREMIFRHPFPGPGLAVRVLGEVKRDALDKLRRADAIFIAELKAADWYDKVAQAFAVFLPVRSVGVMGDGRTYEHVIALRAVQTTDFMTAGWAELPHSLLNLVARRIINEVQGINRVVYDISSKPPATIEWE